MIRLISKFVNSEIRTKGGNAEPLDVTIGKRADVAGTTATNSIFSWIKGLYASLTSLTTTVNTVNTNTARGAIKSIQRGTYDGGTGSGSTGSDIMNVTITISAVTPSKCQVTITGGAFYSQPAASTSSGNIIGYLRSMTSTTLNIYKGGSSYPGGSYPTYVAAYGSWEVVEYY